MKLDVGKLTQYHASPRAEEKTPENVVGTIFDSIAVP
jgi:hypothetical protein